MTRNIVVRVAAIGVAIGLSAVGANAEPCGTVPAAPFACGAGTSWDPLYDYGADTKETACCRTPQSCSVVTGCTGSLLLDATKQYTTISSQVADCCVSNVKCTNALFEEGAYCPYGYAAATVTAVGSKSAAAPTVELCCDRDTTVASFPVCTATASGGTSAAQAPSTDDASWTVQDGNGFTRSVGRYTGMCFSIRIDSLGCTAGHKCCTAKPPAYLQFKIGSAAAPDATCKVSYGTAVANVNSIKRINTWLAIGTGGNAASYFNVPITWKKGSKTGTACIYSIDATATCKLESICGLSGASPAVPDANGNYDKGCELRLVGRKSAASTACCAPTFSVTSFDSTEENRLAGGATYSTTIELQGL